MSTGSHTEVWTGKRNPPVLGEGRQQLASFMYLRYVCYRSALLGKTGVQQTRLSQRHTGVSYTIKTSGAWIYSIGCLQASETVWTNHERTSRTHWTNICTVYLIN